MLLHKLSPSLTSKHQTCLKLRISSWSQMNSSTAPTSVPGANDRCYDQSIENVREYLPHSISHILMPVNGTYRDLEIQHGSNVWGRRNVLPIGTSRDSRVIVSVTTAMSSKNYQDDRTTDGIRMPTQKAPLIKKNKRR